MLERLKALYDSGRLSAAQLSAAVARGWITQDEADVIVGA